MSQLNAATEVLCQAFAGNAIPGGCEFAPRLVLTLTKKTRKISDLLFEAC